MAIGIFYCSQFPMYDVLEIDWLIQNPVRDWELEEEVGEPIWKVEYDADHLEMQYYNRHDTCKRWEFCGVAFEDEAILEDQCALFPYKQIDDYLPSTGMSINCASTV